MSTRYKSVPRCLKLGKLLSSSVGSPYALEIGKQLDLGESSRKLSAPNPAAYTSADSFALDYGVFSLAKKLPSFEGRESLLIDQAISGFCATEQRVDVVNRQLGRRLSSRAESVLSYAKRKVHSILGDFLWSDMLQHCGWGPGATSSLAGRVATLDNKITERALSVTRGALPYARAWLSNDLTWMRARLGDDVLGPCSPLDTEFSIVHGGRLTTVPKDWDKRRTIDVQPTLNLFFQKGVGHMIRTRLRRCGINLNDQGRNQWLASQAQKLGLATIDLESASDSISTRLVEELVPRDWYSIMDDLRTKAVLLPNGKWWRLAKFSAMGNGFTFELESLIFYALIWAVKNAELHVDGPIGVYGDDLIVPSCVAKDLIEVLNEVGFRTNVSKTFIEGRFYESCGKHFFDGIDVTPVYQKEDITDYPSAVRCANRLWRWALRLGLGECLDSRVKGPWELVVKWARAYLPVSFLRKRQWPSQPWTLPDDLAIIGCGPEPDCDRNGLCRFYGVSRIAPRKRGDTRAILHEQLRTQPGSMPTYGWLTPRGEGKWHLTSRSVFVTVRARPVWV